MILEEFARKQIQTTAEQLGFKLLGFTPAQEASTFPQLCTWLENGYAASMHYIERRKDAYRHPESILPNCKSLAVLARPYPPHPWTIRSKSDRTSPPATHYSRNPTQLAIPNSGTIGSYASPHCDYHKAIRDDLKPLLAELKKMFPAAHSRIVVDTAPLLERDYARSAGLGWIGKNTLLLNKNLGSYFFLCAILTEIDLCENLLEQPTAVSHCGSCQACIEACPTEAIRAPYILDANRCISYWTIEHKGDIPPKMRESIGPWIFGCDACQIVCPWNSKSASAQFTKPNSPDIHSKHQPAAHRVEEKSDPIFWLELDDNAFQASFSDTPFWRTGLENLQRNALCVAANVGMKQAIPTIRKFLVHSNPILQDTARWALQSLEIQTSVIRNKSNPKIPEE
jgi:epoxyqueuosine reductase